MNYRMIFKSLGNVLCIEAACMALSLLVSLIYRQEDGIAFLLSVLISAGFGLGMRRIKTRRMTFMHGTGLQSLL